MRPLLLISGWAPVVASSTSAWPNTPFKTSGTNVVDSGGANVSFAGVNWPGAGETMIPEGLQYQSIQTIVSRIKSLGMNSIRLTYATEMVDQIYQNNMSDIPIRKAFTDALGLNNGSTVFDSVRKNNPSFNSSTTRLQVFDAIANECAKQEIYVYLDNHVSKAKWCCTPLDGNSWWGDTYFSLPNWTRGLSYMAERGKTWPNLMAMSLRNELRQPLTNVTLFTNEYNWQTWYARVREGASAVRGSNQDVLILVSGLDSDTTLQPVVRGTALTPGDGRFSTSDFAGYADKLVLELHSYANIVSPALAGNCTALRQNLLSNGFEALSSSAAGGGSGSGSSGGPVNQMPVLLTEFGYPQDAEAWNATYAACLRSFLRDTGAGWSVWALSGSYYLREGVQDRDEPWGLLSHDWSDWRSADHINRGLMPLVQATLSGGGSGGSGGSGWNQTGGGSGGGGGSGSGDGRSEAPRGAVPAFFSFTSVVILISVLFLRL